ERYKEPIALAAWSRSVPHPQSEIQHYFFAFITDTLSPGCSNCTLSPRFSRHFFFKLDTRDRAHRASGQLLVLAGSFGLLRARGRTRGSHLFGSLTRPPGCRLLGRT